MNIHEIHCACMVRKNTTGKFVLPERNPLKTAGIYDNVISLLCNVKSYFTVRSRTHDLKSTIQTKQIWNLSNNETVSYLNHFLQQLFTHKKFINTLNMWSFKINMPKKSYCRISVREVSGSSLHHCMHIAVKFPP